MIATTNTQEINKDNQSNTPKKTNRGRKPKNTVENTKQKITETIAKQTQEQVPTVEHIIHEHQFTYETPNVVSPGIPQFTYETPNVVSP